ncbi:hypothetical protein [Paracidovorax wautersii]|uniref:hypothetical protein n=1 Tax=Paracidovorax wautersii TaxID=1177982 RepID=UPI0031DFC41D
MSSRSPHRPALAAGLRVAAVRIALLSIVLGVAGMAADAAPLVWLSLALGCVGLGAFAAALAGHEGRGR